MPTKATKGVLVTTDVATMIYLLTFREREQFVIREIDQNSIFIEESKLEWVRERVKEFKEKYSYEKPTGN